MQKQKIENLYYLIIQSTYDSIQLGLFNNEKCVQSRIIDKKSASEELIPALDFILKNNKIFLQDLTFIGANLGPAPFTTLRIVISTVNALNFSANLPLIGINGLNTFLLENIDTKLPITVALLNAFNKDVYYALPDKQGCKNIIVVLKELENNFKNTKIKFIGNGANIFKEDILNTFKENAYFQEPNPEACSLESLSKQAYQNWLNKENISQTLIPFYLKEAIVINK